MWEKLVTVALLAFGVATARAQTLFDPDLEVEHAATALGGSVAELSTALIFVDADTALIASRADGRVRRLDLQTGAVVTPGAVVLDLDIVAPDASDSQTEYGVQAMEAHPGFVTNGLVYIRYDQSPMAGMDTPQGDVVLGPNFSASLPTTNVLARYIWTPEANGGDGALALDATIHTVTFDTRYHHGGPIAFGEDGTLYAIYGDLRRDSPLGWRAATAGPLLTTNYAGGVIDDLGVVLRLNDDGTVPADNPFVGAPAGDDRWYAYGVRNSFGLAIDPASDDVWVTDNGTAVFDEINRLVPGSNGGLLVLLSCATARVRVAAAALAAVVVALGATLPEHLAMFSREAGSAFSRENLVFEEESDRGTVQVFALPGQPAAKAMNIDGASIAATRDWHTMLFTKQIVLAHLPMTLDRGIRHTLNLGVASASTLATLARYPWIESLDAVEINPAVIRGARSFPEAPRSSPTREPRSSSRMRSTIC